MKKKYFIFGCALLFIGCTGDVSKGDLQTIHLLSPTGERIEIQVEIADSHEERQMGLMFREHLPADHGMLFIFDGERPLSFWMKNTLIPLDILYFNTWKEFISSTTMEPCIEDPCRGYPAGGPSKYALEVNKGFVDEYGIGEGWVIKTME
jgi:uncharacterized protein